MADVEQALQALTKGEFILVHDSSGRENETDILAAAEKITPQHVARMRTDGGGLICVAIKKEKAGAVGLPYAADVFIEASARFPLLGHIKADDIPYDEKSSFSLMVNHRKTFTGITDEDRALTIRELGAFFRGEPSAEDFGINFRSPGHVPLLISSGLENREGHTELSVALMEMAGLSPVACICEIMDAETYKALSAGKAREYAGDNGLAFLESKEIREAYQRWRNLY